MPVTRSCGEKRRKQYEEAPTCSVATEPQSCTETTTTEGAAGFSSPSVASTSAHTVRAETRRVTAAVHAPPTAVDVGAARTTTTKTVPARETHVALTATEGAPLPAALIVASQETARPIGATPTPVRHIAASSRIPDARLSVAAPPAAMSGQPLHTHRTCSRASNSSKATRALELARAREQLAAARVAVLEAEALVNEEENEDEDVRTTLSDEEPTERVDSWLHDSHTHILAITEHENRDVQQTLPKATPASPVPPPALAAFMKTQALPEAEPPQPRPQVHLPAPQREATFPHPGIATSRPNAAVALQPPSTPRGDIAELAAAITQATRQSQLQPHGARYATELPFFNGNHQEWLCFRAAYNETARFFTDVENTSRLRRNLKGKAKEAVDNLLVSYTQPQEILRVLESRFGRPDAIASTELERLRNLPRPADTPRDVCVFASRVANTVAALKALNRVYYLFNPEITMATVEKLPPTLRYRWFDFVVTQPEEEPDLLKLERFLQREAALCSPFAKPENIANERQQQPQQRRQQQQQQRTFTSQDRPEEQCQSCKNTGHTVTACKSFIEATVNERWDLAKQLRLCFRCLRLRNQKHHCKAKRCDIEDCRYFHHKLLHHLKTPQKISEDKEVVTSSWTESRAQAYLKIAPVHISGPKGGVDTWALLDDGSTVTLIDASIAEEVGARGRIDPLNIEAIADTKLSVSRSRRVSLTLQGQTRGCHRIVARTIQELKLSPQKVQEEDLRACPHLEDLTEKLVTKYATPRLLIGQDNWHLLLAEETRKGKRHQPVASLTPLGWVLHGAHTRALGQRVNFITHDQDEDLNEQLKQHFAMENLMIQPKMPRNDPDRRALEILERNTEQKEDGHYQTSLLWKEDTTQMPDNYEAAVNRLHSIEKKLKKDTVLAEKYREQMNATMEKGYAEVAPQTKTPGKTWYLPHFAVINPLKPEKTRIVHDAAAKTRGKSLNDFLLTGPDLLQSLPGVLMRFRQHAIAVSADITEMFMQVKVRTEDRDALRYLWRDDPNDPPTEYRMTSLIFGATCSPSIAIYVKDANAQKYAETHPEAVSAIVRKHYVDDYLDSYETVEQAVKIAQEVREIHRRGHYELKKWTSNSAEALRQLTEQSEAPSKPIAISEGGNTERVLGLIWNPNTDELAFNLNLARVPREVLESDAPTKREALKIVMSLYDPLGFAAPVTVRAKQILQELWRRGIDWDQRIDNDLADQWREWLGHLHSLNDVAIPRCYLRCSDAISLQLHTFVDASESAYSAALYWRAVTPSGEVTLTLVTAKARVAPLKLTSIPRLELQAAVMGARMATTVVEEHDRKPDSKFFWSDSKTVITWLKTGSRSYRPFVAHRIAAIEEHTTIQEWRWLPSSENVADDATRNVPHDFNRHHRWYVGPEFLRHDEDTWPKEKVTLEKPTGEEKCATIKAHTPIPSQAVPDAVRFSKWERFLRATARTLQFIDLCRRNRQRTHYKRTKKTQDKDPLWKQAPKTDKKTVEMKKPASSRRPYLTLDASILRRAETLIIKASQQDAFAEEITALEKGNAVSLGSRLRPLSLTYVDGVIRIKSRIQRAHDVADTVKSPPVLDGNQHGTRLLIDHIHRQLHHAGVEATINECRQHYWVLRLRPVTRMIVHSCIPCRLRRSTPPQPSTAPGVLPRPPTPAGAA